MANVVPESASRRRVIAVLEQYEIDDLSHTGEVDLLTDPQTHVLSYPLPDITNDKILASILDAGLDRPNTILIQSPFNQEKYVDALDAQKDLALEKHFLFANFCHLLGAKRVTIKQLEIQTEAESQTATFNGGRPDVSGGIDVKRTEVHKVSSEFCLIDEHPENQPRLSEAEALLKSKKLFDDQNMKSLLDIRYSSPNAAMTRTLTVNLSTEANKTLKVAAKLKLPGVKFSADYQSVANLVKEYRVTIEVVF